MRIPKSPISTDRYIFRDRLHQLNPLLPSLVLFILLALIFAIRLRFITLGGYFSSDGKNYLVTMHQVFGNDITGTGLTRPPLIALPLKLLTIIWGSVTGSRILSVLVSVLIGWPFYLLSRRVVPPVFAILGSILFVLNPMYAEMLCWGYITFFGIFFSLFAFYFILKSMDDPSRRNILLAGLMASLVLGFHQTSFIIFMLCAGALFIMLCIINPRRIRRRITTRFLWISLAGILLALPYIPSYISQAHNISGEYVGAIFQLRNVGQIVSRIRYFFGRHTQIWILVGMPILVGLVTLSRRDRWFFWLIIVATLVPLVLNLFDSADLADRSAYFLFFPIWASFSAGLLWLYERSFLYGNSVWARIGAVLTKLIVIAAIAFTGVIVLNTSQSHLQASSIFYNTMDQDMVDAATWLKTANLPQGSNIVVNSSPFADWIRALAARQAFNPVIPLRADWTSKTIQGQVTLATFSGNQSIDNGNLRISTTYPYLQADGLLFAPYVSRKGTGRTAVEALVLAENRATLEYRTAQGPKTVTLAQAASTDFQVTNTDGGICMHTVYRFTEFTLERTVCLKQGERSASVKYLFKTQGDGITFRIPIEMIKATKQLHISEEKIVVEETRAFGSARYQITVAGSGIQNQLLSPEQDSDTSISCEFEMMGKEPSVQFDIDIQVPKALVKDVINQISTPKLLNEYAINYLVMDKEPSLSVDRDALSPYVQSWVDNSPYYFPIYERNGITIYRVRSNYNSEPQHPLVDYVAGGITLLGWTSPGDTIKVEDGLDLLLFWQTDHRTSEDYKIFVHLLDQNGVIVAQYDSDPCRWQCPTYLWQVGQTIIDKRTIPIPPDLAPGEYTLVTGMYIDKTGKRLKATNREGQEWPTDRIVLGKIIVVD